MKHKPFNPTTMKYNFRTVALCLGLLTVSVAANAQTFEKSLDISRTFPVMEMTSLQVENKYGTINIIPWEKDSVRFDIALKVTSSKIDRLDNTFKSIAIDFTANEYFIITRTVFKNQKNRFLAELTDMASSLLSTTNAQIDYTIYLPEDIELTIDHKFGNLYTTNLTGKLNITLSNGDMRANNLTGPVRIYHEFGNLIVNELQNATIEFNYANARINKAESLALKSRATTLEIDDIQQLDLNSRRDQITINHLMEITGDLSFSSLEMQALNKSLIMHSEYGEIAINQIDDSFNLIDLSSTYTDIKLMVTHEAAFDFELIHTKESDVSVAGFIEITNTELLSQDNEIIKVTGYQGKEGNRKSKIRIDIKSGSFKII